jgi:hypothetical protein
VLTAEGVTAVKSSTVDHGASFDAVAITQIAASYYNARHLHVKAGATP